MRLFSTASRSCQIRRLQPKATNRHAVFLVARSESITYHYELDLRAQTPDTGSADLACVELAVRRTRQRPAISDGWIPARGPVRRQRVVVRISRARQIQNQMHLVYAENRFTDDFSPRDPDNYRLRERCDALTYELTGLSPDYAYDQLSPGASDSRYFTLDELRRLWLSPVHQVAGDPVQGDSLPPAFRRRTCAETPDRAPAHAVLQGRRCYPGRPTSLGETGETRYAV